LADSRGGGGDGCVGLYCCSILSPRDRAGHGQVRPRSNSSHHTTEDGQTARRRAVGKAACEGAGDEWASYLIYLPRRGGKHLGCAAVWNGQLERRFWPGSRRASSLGLAVPHCRASRPHTRGSLAGWRCWLPHFPLRCCLTGSGKPTRGVAAAACICRPPTQKATLRYGETVLMSSYYGSRRRIWSPRLSVHVTGRSRMHASHLGFAG
jgi:hypothetical protein